MITGEKVILSQEYNDYPKGTVALYMTTRRESGYIVDVLVIEDKFLEEELKLGELKNLKEAYNRYSSRGDVSLSLFEAGITIIKPDHGIAVTPAQLYSEIIDLQDKLSEKVELAKAIPEDQLLKKII